MAKRKKKQKKKIEREKRRQARRVQENPGTAPPISALIAGGARVIATPADEVKISAALLDVIQPIYTEGMPIDSVRSAVSLGALAWNLSLAPVETQVQMLRDMTEKHEIVRSPDFLATLGMLIFRKLQLYPNDRRAIVSYQVTDNGDEYYVQVASTLPGSTEPNRG